MRTVPTLAAALATLAFASPAAAAPDFGATPDAQRAAGIALGREAFTYGFPLLEVLRVRAENTSVTVADGKGNAPVNTFSHARVFAGPQDRTVVAPNVDTLYSIAHLDLARGPMVLHVPPTKGRYWSFEFVDPYTNVVGYLGRRRNGSAGGTWAITWNAAIRQTSLPKGVRRFTSPYRRLWVIGRTLTTGGKDLAAARRIQDQYLLAPLARFSDRDPAPRARFIRRKPTLVTLPTGLAFLTALGVGLADNPPPRRDRVILARLRNAGIGPGLRPLKAGLPKPVLDGLAAGVKAAAAELPGSTRGAIVAQALADRGWYIPGRRTGVWGTDYTLRAQAALVGLGINTPAEAAYPVALTDSSGQALTGTHQYRLTFAPGQTPPAGAFWSLTMYDSDGYLVADPSNIHAVGDSHPPLARQPDGSIVVALQHDRPADANVNWLPTPPGGFRLNLRLYIPGASFLDGTWKPPGIERLD